MSIINTNVMSLNSQRNLAASNASLGTTIQRLSSGLRINSAKDDAAGLAISERFTTQIRGMNQAARNANDGISLAQTAEGALAEIGNNLQRIRELSVQSRNATNSADDRKALDAEAQLLKAEIQRVADQTTFNGTKLLDGNFMNQAFQVGADQGQVINIAQLADANTSQLGNWTSVATSASATGVAAVGSGGSPAIPGTGGTPATATTSGTSGAWTSAVSNTDGQNFTLDVGGVSILNVTQASGSVETIDAARIDTALTAATGALTTAGITFTGTAAAGDLAFTKADGTDFTVAVGGDFNTAGSFATGAFTAAHTNGTVAVPASGGTPAVPASFSAGSFSLTGATGTATINFSAAGNANQRVSDLVKAVNNQSNTTGVTASKDSSGNLVLASAKGNITVAAGTGADLTEQTGLTAATSTNYVAGSAQVGFSSLSIATADGADNAILAMDAALNSVNSARADLGAIQNRFSSVVSNLNTTAENLSASRSRIRDTDFAKETAELTRTQILNQAGTAMLAQANQVPQSVLSLLR